LQTTIQSQSLQRLLLIYVPILAYFLPYVSSYLCCIDTTISLLFSIFLSSFINYKNCKDIGSIRFGREMVIFTLSLMVQFSIIKRLSPIWIQRFGMFQLLISEIFSVCSCSIK
jgi:hypothetical protein